MYRTALLAALLAVLLPTGAAAGGGGGGFGACNGFGEGAEVTMRDNCFEATAHFTGGGTVSVVNDGAMDHTYTAVDGSFDTGTLRSGERVDVDVAPGIHRVYCTLHSTADGEGMAGVLIVGEPELAVGGPPVAGEGSSLTGLVLAGALLAAFGVVLAVRRRAAARLVPSGRTLV